MQQFCIGAGGELLAAVAYGKFTKQQRRQVLAPFYKSWQDGLLESQDDTKLASALSDFFAKQPTQAQFQLLFAGQYALVNFEVREDALEASCEWAKLRVPDGSASG